FTNYMLPIIFFGKSLVFLTHDAYYESKSRNIPFRYRLAYKIFGTWAAKRATRIMAISEFGKKELVDAYSIQPDRIAVNYLGVDSNKTNYPSPHPKDYILFVGQAFPRRHLKESLLAFEKIAPRFPNLDFIAIGTDKYSPPVIENLVAEINERLGSGRITRRERVSDAELGSFYSHAKALIYISSKEAFGLPPLEALAHGTYPVVADNELSQEIFGDAAFMVSDPESVAEISNALILALTDTAKQYRITARREEILRGFNWPAHADRFLDIVRSIAHA
ncbi:MAG: glycosyltransferase family 1 protein, partial [Candidatus Yanofskybacteria bacterium]|nr:glycosyltransferase family 1 protein [Candidatus Yanofskybacteria bacterium]